jgi:hypothetical protein
VERKRLTARDALLACSRALGQLLQPLAVLCLLVHPIQQVLAAVRWGALRRQPSALCLRISQRLPRIRQRTLD